MFCYKCGKEIPEESTFCHFCGTKLIGFRDISRVNESQDRNIQNKKQEIVKQNDTMPKNLEKDKKKSSWGNVCLVCGTKLSLFSNSSKPYCDICEAKLETIDKGINSWMATKYDPKSFSEYIEQYRQLLYKPSCNPKVKEEYLQKINKLTFGFNTFEEYQNSIKNQFPDNVSICIGDTVIINKVDKVFTVIDHKKYYRKPHKFEELLDFSVDENGNTVTDGRAGSAAAGALLAGTAGAVVGSSMSKKSEQIVKQLSIVLSYVGLDTPVETIDLLEEKIPKTSESYKEKITLCNQIVSALKQIIDSNKKNTEAKEKQKARAIYAFSVADEIMKFKQMADDGIITAEEFDNQKRKLLSLDY